MRSLHEVPEDLTKEEQKRLRGWVNSRSCPVNLSGRELRLLVDECLDHYRGNGNRQKYKDWVAVCRNWIRREYKHEQRKHPAVGSHEIPQERRSPRTEGMAELGQVLELFNDKESA